MKAAIFARVSTSDGRQDVSRQVADLRDLCKKNNWTVAEVITEEISGAKRNNQRAGLQELFTLATSGRIDKVVISEVSRLGRTVRDGVEIIERLNDCGVSIYIQNIGMETLLSDGKPNFMFKPILLTLIGFAEMERELLRERIKSGLENAKRKGKTLGRPKGKRTKQDFQEKVRTKPEYKRAARELRAGQSLRNAAAIAGISVNTVRKIQEVMPEL